MRSASGILVVCDRLWCYASQVVRARSIAVSTDLVLRALPFRRSNKLQSVVLPGEHGDEQYLIRAINRNQVILFLGAGFSTLAKNQRGENLPTGARFAELLRGLLGYPLAYDPSSSSAELYEALLASGKPVNVISDFLTSNLLSVDTPREYQKIVKVFWSRIYTTNVDNLLEQIYAQVLTPRLDIRSSVHL